MPDQKRLPRLMLVTDRRRARLPLPELARHAARGGVDAIQIREKDLSDAELMQIVSAVQEAVDERAAVVVNGNLTVAKRLRIGLHLPEAGIPATTARAELGSAALIGRSVHSPEEARKSTHCDYLIAGHVFPSASKPNLAPIGLDGLRAIIAAAPCPVLAIGGITADSVDRVLEAGSYGIAVISAINNAPDPTAAARHLRDRIDHVEARKRNVETRTNQMTLTINGKDVALPERTTVSDFLATKGLTERMVVVELNGTVLPRAEFASTVLRAGDRVEMVHAVGGG